MTNPAVITPSLDEVAARKRAELGLQNPPAPVAEVLGKAIEVGTPEDMICDCGRTYQGTILRNGEALVRFPPRCEGCRNEDNAERLKRDRQRAADELEDRERQALAAEAKRLELLAVPKYYAGATVDNWRAWDPDFEKQKGQLRVCNFARRYLADWPEVQLLVVFRGIFGSGKSHLGYAIAKDVVSKHRGTARVIEAAPLVRQLRDTWRRESDKTYDAVLAQFLDPDLLVIDELTRHAFYGENIHQHMFDVLNGRIKRRAPTILTSNEGDDGLLEVLKPALLNRLEGEGGIVEFPPSSWRSRPAEDKA